MSKSEFSIDEATGEVLQHDGFIRFVIAKSLYALVERLANTESTLVNTNAQLAVKDTMLSAEMENNRTTQAALEAASLEIAKLKQAIRFAMDDTKESNPLVFAKLYDAMYADTPAPDTPSEPAPVDAPLIETKILPSESIGNCEMCGGDGWLLEPVEGYRAKRIRCKYCDGTGNEPDFDEIYRQSIEKDAE